MCAPPDSRQENAFSAHRRTKSAPPSAAGQPHNGQHVITNAPRWQLAGSLSGPPVLHSAPRPPHVPVVWRHGCIQLLGYRPHPHVTLWPLPRQPQPNGKTSLNGKRNAAAEIARPTDTTTPYRHPTAAEHRQHWGAPLKCAQHGQSATPHAATPQHRRSSSAPNTARR